MNRRPLLYGPNNKPLAIGLYPSIRNNPGHATPRHHLARDNRQNVTATDRREMINISRQLYAQMGNIGSAINDKNSWAFLDAWEPHYTGTNAGWGEEAARFLREQFFPNCDVKGRGFDYNVLLYLSGIAWDRDGDDLMILTEDGNHFPKLAFIPGRRIGNSQDVQGDKVFGGPYDGLQIYDGIILEGNTPVAARVLGVDDRGNETYQDYSLGYGGNADLAYQPEWEDVCRGIPLVGRVSIDGLDLSDIDTFLRRSIKRAASIGLLVNTEDGEAPAANEVPTEVTGETDLNGAAKKVYCEEIDGGENYYFKAGTGETITGIDYKVPHANVEAFIGRIERRCLKALGWNYELIYLSESGRAATRLVCQLGNGSIWKQQKLGLRRTWRAVRYALAKAQKYGFISRNPDKRDAYFSWDFGLPAELSVDQGNDHQSDREGLKMGTTNKALIAQKFGRHWREIGLQRKKEIITNALDAEDIEKQTRGRVSFDKAFELMEQRAANPTAQAPEQPEKPEPDSKDEEQP